MVDLLRQAGGRARMDPVYQTQITRNMMRAFRSGNIGGGLIRAPFAAAELISKPILEGLVPRMKLGVFMNMAQSELARLGPAASRLEKRRVAAEVWNSVENRMGEIAYDNLFWDRRAKDTAMILTRSVGWNIGSLREIGGGLADTVVQAGKLFKGQRPELTQRMAYTLLGLPLVTGIMGSTLNYAMTGEPPKSLKDCFFPRTGGFDEEGNPNRLSLPTYIKDVYHFATEPGRTLANKLHPLVGMVADMLLNKDYYGTEIRHADDPIVKQVMQEAGFAAKQFLPFTARSVAQMRQDQEPLSHQALSMAGFNKAPKSVTQTPAERLADEISQERRPIGGRTEAQAKGQLKGSVARALQKGDAQPAAEAVGQGKLTAREVARLKEDADLSPLQRQVKSMDAGDALRVYQTASDAEKTLLLPELHQKLLRQEQQGGEGAEKAGQSRQQLRDDAGRLDPDLGKRMDFDEEYQGLASKVSNRRKAVSLVKQAESEGDSAQSRQFVGQARDLARSNRMSSGEMERYQRLQIMHAAIEKIEKQVKAGTLKADEGQRRIARILGRG
jgi:hypothetical protein